MVLSAHGFGGGDDGASGSSDPGGQGSIVNGTVVPQSAYPAVGIIGDSSDPSFCSGTLIGSQYVVTAAHCATGTGPTQGRFTLDGQTYGTTHVIVHENYNPSNFAAGYDIAVLRLNQEIAGVTPMAFMTEAPIVGETLTLVGYGNGGTTGSPSFDFPTLREGFSELEQVTSQHIRWRFDGDGESNTASGDSGGPAFVERDGELVIAGVTSGGSQSDWWNAGDNSFDTRVDVFADWIQNLLDGNLPEPPVDDHVDVPGDGATPLSFDGNGHAIGTGEIGINGDRDVFVFSLSASTTATIALNTTGGGLDTYLRLYDSNNLNNPIEIDDDDGPGLNSRIVRTLDAGTYYASAGAYADSTTGTYVLDIDVDPAAVQIPGDFDGDNDVDGDDFLIWQNNFGTAGPDGDANGDGIVDGDDFLIWQNNFGTGSGAGVAAQIAPSLGTASGERLLRPLGQSHDSSSAGELPMRLRENNLLLVRATVRDLAIREERIDSSLDARSELRRDRVARGTRGESHDRVFSENQHWRSLRIGRAL